MLACLLCLPLVLVLVCCNDSDQEIKQIVLCFFAGIFPSSVLALVAQSLLVPVWALLCFFDQRESLDKQLRKFIDTSDASADDSSAELLLTSSSSSSSGGLGNAPPHASRLADLLAQLDVEKTFGYYVFLFALAFCVAALVEESLKLWIVQGACCCSKLSARFWSASKPGSTMPNGAPRPSSSVSKRGWLCHPSRLLFQHQRHSSHSFVVFMAVVAGALGFSFFENMGYAFAIPAFGDRVLAAVLRGLLSTPLHCICGGITGVRLAERLQLRRTVSSSSSGEKLSAVDDLAKWRTKLRIVLPAILVHGTFDFQVFLVASLVTEEMTTAHPIGYGLVAPSVGTLGILVGAFWYLRRILHAMEQQMNAGRYIQVAVDLESGRRVGFSDDDSDLDDDGDDGEGFSAGGRDQDRSGTARKSRSVFNV